MTRPDIDPLPECGPVRVTVGDVIEGASQSWIVIVGAWVIVLPLCAALWSI